MKIVNNTSF